MVLSSNWLELQKKAGDGTFKKRKSNKKSSKIAKPSIKSKREPSKVMQVVYEMNHAIKKVEEDKKQGKQPSLKSESPSKLDELLGKDVSITKMKNIGKFIAMDAEFVGVGPDGKENALARVSLVNYNGYVIMDEYVKPREKVVDWRTWVSGIESKHMKIAMSYKDVQQRVADILQDRILVGHAVAHDLSALALKHPRSMIRDTSLFTPFRKEYANGKTPSLKKLAKKVLDLDIQNAEHSSVEDAKMTMLLYKSRKKEIDRFHTARTSSA